MKRVFADAVYWIAIVRPGDAWAEAAKSARKNLGDAVLMTTDEVLTECLNILGGRGPHLRRLGVGMVRKIQDHPNVQVVPQSRKGFLEGLQRYEQREDKATA